VARPAGVTVIGDRDPGRSFCAVGSECAAPWPASTAGSRATPGRTAPALLDGLGRRPCRGLRVGPRSARPAGAGQPAGKGERSAGATAWAPTAAPDACAGQVAAARGCRRPSPSAPGFAGRAGPGVAGQLAQRVAQHGDVVGGDVRPGVSGTYQHRRPAATPPPAQPRAVWIARNAAAGSAASRPTVNDTVGSTPPVRRGRVRRAAPRCRPGSPHRKPASAPGRAGPSSGRGPRSAAATARVRPPAHRRGRRRVRSRSAVPRRSVTPGLIRPCRRPRTGRTLYSLTWTVRLIYRGHGPQQSTSSLLRGTFRPFDTPSRRSATKAAG
jgi:hypothetical protein